jgi:8-oxo-dGTP diphosphatase
MEERPKVGVGTFIKKDNKILLLKRKNAHGDGTWSLVGGHLEFKETPEQCAVREVMEEAGIKIKNPKSVAFTNDIFEEENNHYITIYVMADYESGEVSNMEPQKCEKLEWHDWSNLPSPLFIPVQNLIKQGFDPFKI